MHPVKRKFVTSTFLLIFFYFPKSINGDIESGTCDAKNACVKHDKFQSKIFFEPQLLERETRMVNVRNRVGSEKLVNNRRIVDSDSRISDDIHSRNFDFPRLSGRSRTLSHEERTNGRTVPESQIRRDFQVRASINRDSRSASRTLDRESRSGEFRFRDSRDVRLVEKSNRMGEDTRRVVEERRDYESRIRNSQDRQVRIRTSPERQMRLIRTNAESSVRLTHRVERRNSGQQPANSRRVRSVESRLTPPVERSNRMGENTRRIVEERQDYGSRIHNSQDRQVRILERTSPEREMRLITTNAESSARLTHRVGRQQRDNSRRVRVLSVESRLTPSNVERRNAEREVNRRNSQIDQRTINRESRERNVRLNERNEIRSRVNENSKDRDSKERLVDERVHDERVTEDRSRDRSIEFRRTTRNLDERNRVLRSRERRFGENRRTVQTDRRIVKQERRTGERRISDISNRRLSTGERLSSEHSVDINNNIRVTDRRALEDSPHNHQPTTTTYENYASKWSNLLTTTFGILILIQIVTTSNTKKYGIPKITSFLHGVKEKVY